MANKKEKTQTSKTLETSKKTETNVKTTSQTTVDKKSVEKEKLLEIENESLKSKMAEMESKMNLLIQQFGFLNNPVVKQNRDVEVINLTVGSLILSTNGKANGRLYIFDKQFDSIKIPENDLKLIVLAMPKCAQGGYFYINDNNFVEENNLSYSYRTILSQTDMKDILSLKAEDFMTKYNSASSIQQKIIESMIVSKKFYGEYVDANILIELEKITGKRYQDIQPFIKE